jgi:hypothetical protein
MDSYRVLLISVSPFMFLNIVSSEQILDIYICLHFVVWTLNKFLNMHLPSLTVYSCEKNIILRVPTFLIIVN